MKILYFCSGEGLGHATRSVAAGKVLLKEHEVVFGSYEYAKDFLEKSGFEVRSVPSEVRFTGSSGSFDLKQSIIKTIREINPSGVLAHKKLIDSEKPDLIISDSFVSPALVGVSKRIPTWMILNQTNVEKFFYKEDSAIKWIGGAVKKFNYSALEKMDKILVPDFAPPFTICEGTLELNNKIFYKTVFLGPLIRKNVKDFKSEKKIRACDVFASIGGFGYRSELLYKVLSVANKLKNKKFVLVSGPNGEKIRGNKKVKCYSVVQNPLDFIKDSSLVICGGGHSTIMESVCLGKPVLSFPDNFHFEQEQNATQLQNLGLGFKLSYKTPVELIEELIDFCLKDKELKNRLGFFKRLAVKCDGRKKLLELVNEEKKIL